MKNLDVVTWGFHEAIYRLPRNIRYFDPREIRYTQDCIYPAFKDGTRIRWLSNNLDWGVCKIDQVEPIRVMISNRGIIWSLDNRRLWAYKCANLSFVPVIVVSYHQVEEEFKRKKTTTTNGFSVKLLAEVNRAPEHKAFIAARIEDHVQENHTPTMGQVGIAIALPLSPSKSSETDSDRSWLEREVRFDMCVEMGLAMLREMELEDQLPAEDYRDYENYYNSYEYDATSSCCLQC